MCSAKRYLYQVTGYRGQITDYKNPQLDACYLLPERWVPPFGNQRIKGSWPLPAAYRSLARPSSPAIAKASTRCSYLRLRIVLSFSGFGVRHHRNRNRILLVRCLTLTESQLSYFYSVTDQPALPSELGGDFKISPAGSVVIDHPHPSVNSLFYDGFFFLGATLYGVKGGFCRGYGAVHASPAWPTSPAYDR